MTIPDDVPPELCTPEHLIAMTLDSWQQAIDVLRTLKEYGFAIVPVEPTTEMLMAAGAPYAGNIPVEEGLKLRRQAWLDMLAIGSHA